MKRFAAALMLAFAAFVRPAAAVEVPPFALVASDGDFEIRDYPALVVAETTVAAARNDAAYAGFRKLAGYIFGANGKSQEIAMTAPVVEQRSGAPLVAGPATADDWSGEGWLIRFTMPRGHALGQLPPPKDAAVRLRQLPAARVAVVKFSGLGWDGDVAERTRALLGFLARRGLRAAGPASFAQYDPPWTPGFLRRNEVMIPVAR